MKSQNIPSVTFPVHDYGQIVTKNNHSLVNILLEQVLSISQRRRISPTPPIDHDAYAVSRLPDRIIFRIFHDGDEVFRCILIPPTEN